VECEVFSCFPHMFGIVYYFSKFVKYKVNKIHFIHS
jgi:hypothetical protein